MVSATGTRDPKRVRAGQIGARQRWGEPRIARLDELTADQRRLVLALIGAMTKTEPAASEVPASSSAEVCREHPTRAA
jgi:hypothetical protein